MKIYARQISPEYQESPLFIDECFPDNIAVCGNRDFNEHIPDIFKTVSEVLENGELAEMLEDIKACEWYKNATEAITDYLPPVKGRYSTNAVHALKNYVCEYATCPRCEEERILLCVLAIVTGKKWDSKIIRGCCQSDWNYIYYPVDEWSKEALEAFETEYFNTGTEWIVHDEEGTPEAPEEINGFSMYCISWNDEGIRKEIADVTGGNPQDVVLYAFDGYIQTAKYREVTT